MPFLFLRVQTLFLQFPLQRAAYKLPHFFIATSFLIAATRALSTLLMNLLSHIIDDGHAYVNRFRGRQTIYSIIDSVSGKRRYPFFPPITFGVLWLFLTKMPPCIVAETREEIREGWRGCVVSRAIGTQRCLRYSRERALSEEFTKSIIYVKGYRLFIKIAQYCHHSDSV